MARLITAIAAAFALVAAACDGGDQAPVTEATPPPERTPAAAPPVEAACSASGTAEEITGEPDLPGAVAKMRQKVAGAALRCDFNALGSLAQRDGRPFTFSFGDGEEPAEFWRKLEEQGEEPLRFLVGVLDRPFATIESEGTIQYVWPSAFAFESWKAVPQPDREALKPLYDEDDFEDFARFGAYTGYRAGISESGEWLFFVAGD